GPGVPQPGDRRTQPRRDHRRHGRLQRRTGLQPRPADGGALVTRKAQYAAVVALLVVVSALIAYRATHGGGAVTARGVIVLDRSDSTRDVCAAVAGVAERLLAELPWRKGSALVLLGTGDDETLGEPVELFRYADFRRGKTVEGKAAGAR